MKTASLSLRNSAASRVMVMSILSIMLTLTAAGYTKDSFLYLQSNNVSVGQNSIIGYERLADGTLKQLPGSPFLTGGTGINNSTNGKLGPNDNDTPIALSADGKRLFAVNGNSNTIAVFDIMHDGSLRHIKGSPFSSMGVGPVSLAVADDILIVANRNEDPHQLEALRGAAFANYASFWINKDGSLKFVSKMELKDGQKPTQVLVSSQNGRIIFGNDFQVDADFDGEGNVSKLFSKEAAVRGRINAFMLDAAGRLTKLDSAEMPETVTPAPEVPTVPLGIWDHPKKSLVYVGLVTRNQLGVFRYSGGEKLTMKTNGATTPGILTFVSAVPNSGQDICWLRVNKAGTRLYAVNNLPREDAKDGASTITVFDISGSKAEKPVEISRIELPLPGGMFVNNRNAMQPNSAAFQLDLDPSESFLYVISQRINQTVENTGKEGNILHILKIDKSGKLSVVDSRRLGQDGVHYNSRPQGIVTIDM